MTSVEAAASLFGPDDTASDPFASLGGTDEAEPTTTTHGSTPDASGLFGSNEETPSYLSGEESSQQASWPAAPTHDPYGQSTVYSQDSSAGQGSAQGWYDANGQWRTHEGYPAPMSNAHDTYTTSNYAAQASPYVPYTPTTNSSLHPNPTAQHLTHSQSAYDAYKPPVTPSTSAFSVPSSSSYDPYKPTASASYQGIPQTASPYAYAAQTSYGNPPASLPPPPKPATEAPYRPKKFDAYDPPLPPIKTKRAVSRPTMRSKSPAVGQQTYSAYDSYNGAVGGPYSSPPPPVPALPHSAAAPDPYGRPPSGASTFASPPRNPPINSYGHDYNGGQAPQAATYTPAHLPPRSPPQGQSPYDPTEDTPRPKRAYSSDRVPSRNGSYHDYAPHEPSSDAYPAAEPVVDEESAYTSPPPPSSSALPNEQTPSNGFTPDRQPSLPPPPPRADSYRVASPQSASGSQRGSLDLPGKRRSAVVSPPVNPQQRTQSPYDPARTTSPASVRSWTAAHDPLPQSKSRAGSLSHDQANGFRSASPGAVAPSLYSGLPASSSSNPYAPVENTQKPVEQPPPASQPSAYDPYSPKLNGQASSAYQSPSAYGVERASSPGSTSIRSRNGSQSVVSDPYAPSAYAPSLSNGFTRPDQLRGRSTSNATSSGFSSTSTSMTSVNPYAPSQHSRNQGSQPSDYGDYSSRYNYPYGSSQMSLSESNSGQEITLAAPTHAAYAPSPSLMGTNDPLGRTAARVPVFSFGFGGKVVTCFHGSSVLNTGFDVALSSRHSNDIQIRVLHKVIPGSALDNSSAVYPGPLFADPGTPSTTNLVRTGASQTKAKKARVIKYLEERSEELSQGIPYLHAGSEEKRRTEGKLALVRLLKVMVENDGRLSGSAAIDGAIRAALVPRLSDAVGSSPEIHAATPFGSVSDLHSPLSDMNSAPYAGLGLSNLDSKEAPIAVNTLRPSALEKIQEFLLRGERRKAYHYALDEKLWAHAMVIASSIDSESWKEVVRDFLKTELGTRDDTSRTNGRESLRVAYSLFSGQGAASVQELIPPNLLSKPQNGTLQIPAVPTHLTPVSPSFPAPAMTASIPVESLAKWPETVAMMLSSPMTPETSAALTTLGDYLAANQWTEAAHVCYLLAPQTSQLGGAGAPSVRVVLLGSRSPLLWPSFHKDPDSIIFSEIAEFALSLVVPAKGQDAFAGLPHLQAYRLIHAMSLAEIGHIQHASRYCEAISASLSRTSPYVHAYMVEQLRGLSDRLTGAPHIDKSGSWMKGNLSKPSLDSIGNWLEGRLTKFIAGEGDASPPPTSEIAAPENTASSGPFSHYSTISSATPSTSPSPQPSFTNLSTVMPPPPRRSGSAMETHSGPNTHAPIDRASSAMDYSRPYGRKPSPSPRVASANAVTTTFTQSQSFGQAFGAYNPPPQASPELPTPRGPHDSSHDGQEVTWWGSSSIEDSSGVTPTAGTFMKVDESASPSTDGFISLMDSHSITVTPSSPLNPTYHGGNAQQDDDDDDDDLGLGNSKKDREREKAERESDTSNTSTVRPASTQNATPERPELKTANTGSWISRWWKKGDASPGPVKASLGEETTFYYDKEQKRWVNKKAGEESPKPAAPPPPPSRAQTASPGRASGKPPASMLSGPPPAGPPPSRPASARPASMSVHARSPSGEIDISTSPPTKSIPRMRSNLVPVADESSPSPSPGLGDGLTPPPSRPRSQASRKNIRNRYVDVFQQPGAGGA